METKQTFKPDWKVEGESGNEGEAFVIVSDSLERTICWTGRSLGAGGYPEREVISEEDVAVAKLIAAAPELLEACKAFVVAWKKCLQLEKTDVALRLAEDAIEKATS